MWKICTKCGKHKALWEFYKNNKGYFSTGTYCIRCAIEYQTNYYNKEYKQQANKLSLKYYYKNQDDKKEYQLNYYHSLTKEEKLKKIKVRNGNGAIYVTFKDRLTVDEDARPIEGSKYMEAKCKLCKKYFRPTYGQVWARILALSDDTGRENNLYCSEECKHACPVFNNHGGIPSVSLREKIPQELRNEVLQRNDGMCEMCGEQPSKEIHHEKPVATHPHLQLDKENLWGLCEYCHYEVCHQIEGCTLPELKRKSINNCKI